MTPQELSDIYNGYIDCLNDQAWSRLSIFVHDDVQHNENRIGVPGYQAMFEGDFSPPSPAGYSVSEPDAATGVLMMRHPAGYRGESHCAPAPVLGTVLTGSVRIETSDGYTRSLSPGDQFLAGYTSGTGHRMEELNGDAYVLALVLLDGCPGGDGT